LILGFRPPLDGAGLLAFFAARAVPGVEEVVDGAYRRSLRLAHGGGVVELRPGAEHVDATLSLDDERDRDEAVRRCRVLLDLDRDPGPVAERLGADPALAPLVRAAPGRRVPGAADGAELAVRALIGQQISVAAARTLAGRLVAAHGEPLRTPVGSVTHVFPTAAALAEADLAAPESRRRALRALTAALAEDPSLLRDRERLLALPGIGPWTVAYIAMRALHDPDAFMPTDLGVRHGLERLGLDGSPRAAAAAAERWRPYRAYAVVHLWSA
jgi:AraC family transcriptional regulator, regulatory protein of adaptative response / DNA-3-methyladenine glycosylase II